MFQKKVKLLTCSWNMARSIRKWIPITYLETLYLEVQSREIWKIVQQISAHGCLNSSQTSKWTWKLLNIEEILTFWTSNPHSDFWAIYKPLLFSVVFYLISVAMYLVSFFLSKFALLKETEMRKESRLLPRPQTPSRDNSLRS